MAHNRDAKQRKDADVSMGVILAVIFVPVAMLHVAAAAPAVQAVLAAIMH
jgi:hypothetical protein